MTGQPPATDAPVFYTDQDVARILQVPVAKVQRLARTGELPGVKVGREWRFQRQAINDLGRNPSTPQPVPIAGLHPRSAARIRRRAVA
jgi:excisionase family DNA binding protein